MTDEDVERQELAGGLAKGEVTVSQAYVLQGQKLRDHFQSFPPGAPIPKAHGFWTALHDRGGIPSRRDIDPTGIPSDTLPHIVMIDVSETPKRRFRYRLVGTAVEKIFGADYTGRYMDEMGLGAVLDRIQAFYSLVCNDPQPALLTGSYEAKSGLTFEVGRLAMPLSEDGTRIDTLFCAVQKT